MTPDHTTTSPDTRCPTCHQPRRRRHSQGPRGGYYYHCYNCRRTTLAGEPARPPILPREAQGRYLSQDEHGALQQLLYRYEQQRVSAATLAEEQGVTLRTIYRRLRWARNNRASS